MCNMKIIGIDLSGPANHKDTVMTIFQVKEDRLIYEDSIIGASDEMLLKAIYEAASTDEVVVGIDAPLSYQDGGGDRPQDKSIRNVLKEHGLSGSSIMPPTLTRMVYLTLRGIALTRTIMASNHSSIIKIVEVHPGAAIGTRIGKEKLQLAREYKKDIDSRIAILNWFEEIGLKGIPTDFSETSHQVDACGAALAAWHWVDPTKQPTWQWKTTNPNHPFELCC
jgi:predicted nuclease with RNAse H fold